MKFKTTSLEKDADATLDYKFDMTNWLDGDTIASHTVTVDTGITKNSDAKTTTDVTVWLSGGTAGSSYKVTCRITTAGGRTDEGVVVIRVV